MITEFQNENRWLSNFAPVKIILDGLEFQSVEHAYMSAKLDDKEWKKFCSDLSNSAGTVKRKSRNIKLKSNWDRIKLKIMASCLEQKFMQEPYTSFEYWKSTYSRR